METGAVDIVIGNANRRGVSTPVTVSSCKKLYLEAMTEWAELAS